MLPVAILFSVLHLTATLVVGGYLLRYQSRLTDMLGMMMGMVCGMLSGLAVGTWLGLATDMFISNLGAMAAGLMVGVGFGRVGSIVGALEGGLGGVMGGMMGAMLGVMLPRGPWEIGITAGLLVVLHALGLAGLVRLVQERCAQTLAVDPVCGMAVDPAHAPASVVYQDRRVYFCASACRRAFERNPERYSEPLVPASEQAQWQAMSSVVEAEVSEASTAARHDERRQLSFTLHNSLAQQVGFLHLSLDRLADPDLAVDPAALPGELAGLRDVAGDAYQQIRDLLAGLRSPTYHSLNHLLDNRLQVFARATGLDARLRIQGESRLLSPEMNQQLFSLIHEGLNNIQKHAGARQVTLNVDWREQEVALELSDDGRGFEPQPSGALAGHYGLVMLQEQAAHLNGRFQVISAVGQGTRLIFYIPLNSETDFLPIQLPAKTTA